MRLQVLKRQDLNDLYFLYFRNFLCTITSYIQTSAKTESKTVVNGKGKKIALS